MPQQQPIIPANEIINKLKTIIDEYDQKTKKDPELMRNIKEVEQVLKEIKAESPYENGVLAALQWILYKRKNLL